SPDGNFFYFSKTDNRHTIYRASKSGLDEEALCSFDHPPLYIEDFMPAPVGKRLWIRTSTLNGTVKQAHILNLQTHQMEDLGDFDANDDGWWYESGKSLTYSRTVNRLQNLWKYTLADRAWTEVTFGSGPDTYQMADPNDKGIFYVN